MGSHLTDETWQVKYLLGNLTEEEQVQVEDRAFADPDYLTALEATEADLIDAYVRGELSPADRRSFEFQFLTSPERLRKVEFARALAAIPPDPQAHESRTARQPFFMKAFWGWNLGAVAAGIAALICLAAGAWLLSQNAAIRARVATLEAERRDVDVQEQRLRQQLSEAQTRADALATQNQHPPDTTRKPLVASLVLIPGLSRAQTRVPQLVLDPTMQIARIEIPLESRDDYPRFRAELRTLSGDEILSRGNLVRRKAGPGFVVSVDIPASALAAGDYELALKGIAADHSREDIGYYYFAVQRR